MKQSAMNGNGGAMTRKLWWRVALTVVPFLAASVVVSCSSECCTAPPFTAVPAGSPTPTPVPLPSGFVSLGLVLVGDDGLGFCGGASGTTLDGITFIKVEDSAGNPIPSPSPVCLTISGALDLDGQDLTPDATEGATVDGGNLLHFFSGTNTGSPVLAGTINITAFGGDGDAIVIHPNGDEAIASADGTCPSGMNCLVVISGIKSGSPVLADTVAIPALRDGLTLSRDGTVLLAREASSGLTVFSVATTAPHTGSGCGATPCGSTSLSFTKTADLASGGGGGGGLDGIDGRDGMAFCPTDSSRAVVINAPASGMVSLLTGLPSAPVLTSIPVHIPLSIHRGTHPLAHSRRMERNERGRPLSITPAVTSLFSVSVTPGCGFAYVGTDSGIVTISGVNTGSLAQVGSPFNPTFTVSGTSTTLGSVPTLAITVDGKFIAAFSDNPSGFGGPGTELTLSIGSSGGLSVVGQTNSVGVPANDQALAH